MVLTRMSIQTETISGTIERITYFNAENGYSVVKITPEGIIALSALARDGTVAVVGTMVELAPGETVRFTGSWVSDPKYGMQFRAEMCEPVMPVTEVGITAYLSSGIVKGIGQRTAEKIVKHFGTQTIDVLDNEPHRLADVPGLKKTLATSLAKAWTDNMAVRQTMIFLQSYGVGARTAARIYQHYGSAAIRTVKDNPYTLADDVYGIGFIKADSVAQKLGIPLDAPNRIRAGLRYALNTLSNEGHVYAPREKLIDTAGELLRVDNPDLIRLVLSESILAGEVIAEQVLDTDGQPDDAIYLTMFNRAERGAANRFRAIAGTPSAINRAAIKLDIKPFLAELSESMSIQLTAQQQDAVRAALYNKISVLTGGPGTGKTTTLKMVIGALEELDFPFALASPTGRAARRLSEATGHPASTIHRLLGWNEGQFIYDEENPLQVSAVVVDEASMIDLMLFNSLLKAIPPHAHLMLVGDIDQLPSVGAGNVLRDVIDSGMARVTRLNVIFRQADDSHIITNAHRINQGQAPFTDNRSRDFFFFGEEDPEKAAELVVDIVKHRVPSRFGYDPVTEVQVIAPMYRGAIGVNALNDLLQASLNGDERLAQKQIGPRTFRVGDKIMQTRNNYEKEVFNGDIGYLRGINFDDQIFEVVMDGRFIEYDWMEAEDLIHAYCISTHRSQGSEYPVVVMPLLTQHYMMLQRNLLYTAVTRAKQVVILVGMRKAIEIAVKNNKVSERYTALQWRLKGDGL